jgi:hypothetical protein
MHLDLTPEEFERLLKLAYLGEAVTNDWTPAEQHSPQQAAATDLLYDLCAKAQHTPARDYVSFDERAGEWAPSEALNREMDDLIGRYDNEVFWDELLLRLARRDMLAEYGQQAIDGMSEAYRKRAELSLIEYYSREVKQHGLDRFVLKNEAQPIKPRAKSRGKKHGRSRRQSGGQHTP